MAPGGSEYTPIGGDSMVALRRSDRAAQPRVVFSSTHEDWGYRGAQIGFREHDRRRASGARGDSILEAVGPNGFVQHALAVDLQALAEAHPDVLAGRGARLKMKLAATELNAQKREIEALNLKLCEVKRDVTMHLDMLGDLFEEDVEGFEDASFFPKEREALMMLQGAMLEILDMLNGDAGNTETILYAEAPEIPRALVDIGIAEPSPGTSHSAHPPSASLPGQASFKAPARVKSPAQAQAPAAPRTSSPSPASQAHGTPVPPEPALPPDPAPLPGVPLPVHPRKPTPVASNTTKAGQAVKEALLKVVKLRHAGKKGSAAEAKEVLDSIPAGKTVQASMLDKLAKSLEDQVFRVGGMKTMKAVVKKLLSRTLMRFLVPEGTQDPKEEEVKNEIINAAKDFFNILLNSKGRRSNVDTNAFWAAAVALLPTSLFKDNKGRTAMRLLHINYRTVQKANEIRGRMEEEKGGWRLITTAPHSDRVHWGPLIDWCHSDEASVEDNDNKQVVKVYQCKQKDDAEIVVYEEHPRRYLRETVENLRPAFLKSAEFGKMSAAFDDAEKKKRRKWAEARLRRELRARADMDVGEGNEPTVDEVDAEVHRMTLEYQKKEGRRRARRLVLKLAEKRREPTEAEVEAEVAKAPEYPTVVVSMKHFRKGFCKCIMRRKGSECDCQLCTYVTSNLSKFHRARTGWRLASPCTTRGCGCGAVELAEAEAGAQRRLDGGAQTMEAADDEPVRAADVTLALVSARIKAADFAAATRSPHHLMKYVLCDPLPDAEVNGPLNEDPADDVHVDEDPAARWRRLSPRWLTLKSAKVPFSCYRNYCVTNQCAGGLFNPRATK